MFLFVIATNFVIIVVHLQRVSPVENEIQKIANNASENAADIPSCHVKYLVSKHKIPPENAAPYIRLLIHMYFPFRYSLALSKCSGPLVIRHPVIRIAAWSGHLWANYSPVFPTGNIITVHYLLLLLYSSRYSISHSRSFTLVSKDDSLYYFT